MQSRDHETREYQACRKKHPELEVIVEVAAVVNALDQVGAADGDLHDLARVGVDLYLTAILSPDFDHTLARSHIETSDVIPRFDLSLWNRLCHFQDAIEAE